MTKKAKSDILSRNYDKMKLTWQS